MSSGLCISVRPFGYRIARRLRGAGRPEHAGAVERVELAPGTRIQSFDAISLPDEEYRATGVMSGADLAHERMGARRCIGVNGATIAYRYDDALIADACWYSGGDFESLRVQKRRPVLIANAERIVEAQLCASSGAEQYFGHWLCDALSTELLAEERGLPALALSQQGDVRQHEPGYRELVDLQPRRVDVARIDRLWIVDDRGYNQQRIDRFLALRHRIRTRVAAQPSTRSAPVFIDRGQTGATRRLTNRDEIVERLIARGFRVIAPERMKPFEIAAALVDATLVVGVEGSHLNHALMAAPAGTGLLAIQPPDRFNMFNKYMCEYASMRFGFVVADAAADGFSLEPDRLERTLDLFGALN